MESEEEASEAGSEDEKKEAIEKEEMTLFARAPVQVHGEGSCGSFGSESGRSAARDANCSCVFYFFCYSVPWFPSRLSCVDFVLNLEQFWVFPVTLSNFLSCSWFWFQEPTVSLVGFLSESVHYFLSSATGHVWTIHKLLPGYESLCWLMLMAAILPVQLRSPCRARNGWTRCAMGENSDRDGCSSGSVHNDECLSVACRFASSPSACSRRVLLSRSLNGDRLKFVSRQLHVF